MTQELATRNGSPPPDVIEQVVAAGDLADLTARERANYYGNVCRSLGLNPYTRPFEYIRLNGKLTLYARKDATDQLRNLRRVSIVALTRETLGDLYVVTARAQLPDGRTDEEIGAVPIGGLKGESLANAMMKASTKAKRRVTLSICGLGWLDETEVDSIPDARGVSVDLETGEIRESLPAPAEPPPEIVLAREMDRARELWRECRDAGLPVTPPWPKDDQPDLGKLVAWSADWTNRLEIQRQEAAESEAAAAEPTYEPDSQDEEAERVDAAFEQLESAAYKGPKAGEVAAMRKKLDAARIAYDVPPEWQDPTFVDDWLTRMKSKLWDANPANPRNRRPRG